ncbi:phospholipase effector Tle1 domain-containing protein [Marinobacter alexandrii]|uniref:phospholipase effector Tle1 domain-containing protein n=1 Tax=Marinobacter alexandrii TaxID=2570351 RepID=UPI003CD0C92F
MPDSGKRSAYKNTIICLDCTRQSPNSDTGIQILRNAPENTANEGMDKNILDCYRYLMHYYEEEASYFFGFSRSVCTVRSLVGLMRNCGIVRGEPYQTGRTELPTLPVAEREHSIGQRQGSRVPAPVRGSGCQPYLFCRCVRQSGLFGHCCAIFRHFRGGAVLVPRPSQAASSTTSAMQLPWMKTGRISSPAFGLPARA